MQLKAASIIDADRARSPTLSRIAETVYSPMVEMAPVEGRKP